MATKQKKSKRAPKPKKANGAAPEEHDPMKGKKLLQTWVDEAVHDDFCDIAEEHHLRPSTYLRQVIHAHVDMHRKARAEGQAVTE